MKRISKKKATKRVLVFVLGAEEIMEILVDEDFDQDVLDQYVFEKKTQGNLQVYSKNGVTRNKEHFSMSSVFGFGDDVKRNRNRLHELDYTSSAFC